MQHDRGRKEALVVLQDAVKAVVTLDASWAKRTPEQFEADWLRPLIENRSIREVILAGEVAKFAAVAGHPKIRLANPKADETEHIVEAFRDRGTEAVLRLQHTTPFRFPLTQGLLDAAIAGYQQQAAGGYFRL